MLIRAGRVRQRPQADQPLDWLTVLIRLADQIDWPASPEDYQTATIHS